MIDPYVAVLEAFAFIAGACIATAVLWPVTPDVDRPHGNLVQRIARRLCAHDCMDRAEAGAFDRRLRRAETRTKRAVKRTTGGTPR